MAGAGIEHRQPGEARPPARRRHTASLLDVDAQMARRIPSAERDAVRRHLMVRVRCIPRGSWSPFPVDTTPPLAYVIVEGTLLRAARVEQRWSTELLGPEDVLRPWDDFESPAGLSREDRWTALEPLRVAVLDWRFAAVAARWPQLLDEVLARSSERSARLLTLMCLSTIRRLDLRLLVLLRIFADRWGYAAPDGIHLTLQLTHETLARLACAQRPSVSTTIGRLVRAGSIRREGRAFVLPLELPEPVRHELNRVRHD